MNKALKIVSLIVLFVCLVAMCICIAFVVIDGLNAQKQGTQENDQVEDNISKSVAVVTTANSFDVTSSDNAVTYGFIGGVQFNMSKDGGSIDITGAFGGSQTYLEVSINSTMSYSASTSVYSKVVFNDFYDEIAFYSLNLRDLISAGTLSYDTQYYLFARDTVSGSWVDIMDFTVLAVTTELPEPPIKTGYTFTGWYTDEECTNLYEEDYVTEDITLYAGFRANTYNVVLNPNGASGNAVTQSFIYDKSQNLKDVSFTKEFFKLIGWSTSANGEVVFDLQESVSNLSTVDGDTVQLYAVWERVSYLVTFIVDGKPYAKVEVEAGTNISDVLNSNVDTLLFYVSENDLNSLPAELTSDMSITLQKTQVGEIVTQPWVMPVAITVICMAVVGIALLIIDKVKSK